MSKRQQLAHALGANALQALGYDTARHTPQGLVALGGHLILQHFQHGDDDAGIRLLLAMAKQAGALDDQILAGGDRNKIAERLHAFLATEFKEEFAVSDAAEALACLRPPARHALARELLKGIGLDPERRVETPPTSNAETPAAETPNAETPPADQNSKKAVDFYFSADTLSADDIRRMSARPLSDADIAAKLARLPKSLEAEFNRRFRAYTEEAADKSVVLINAWLSCIATHFGLDLGTARLEIATARLQYYRRQVQTTRSAFVYDDKTLHETPAAGYIATIHTPTGPRQFFLSTRDGSILPIPAGGADANDSVANHPAANNTTANAAVADWLHQHAHAVFEMFGPPDNRQRSRLPARVQLDPLAQGQRHALTQWLKPALYTHVNKARENAGGQTPGEHAIDTPPDFIPFQRTILATQRNDIETALPAGGIMAFTIPALGSRLRSAARAKRIPPPEILLGRGISTSVHEIAAGTHGASEIGTGTHVGAPTTSAGSTTLLDAIQARLGTAVPSFETPHTPMPLDAEVIVQNLYPNYPEVAATLERAAQNEHGTDLRDGLYSVPTQPRSAANASNSDAIEVLKDVQAVSGRGHKIMVRPYGDNSGRAYLLVDPNTKEAKGNILLADRHGKLYKTLTPDTLQRCRVTDSNTLNALSTSQPAANGTIALDGKTYARILDDYVEIVPDRTATANRPVWRVVPQLGIVPQRITYNSEKELWLLSGRPEMRAGSGRGDGSGWFSRLRSKLGSRSRPGGSQGSLQDFLVSRIRGGDSNPQVQPFRQLLTRLEADPRTKGLLRALQAREKWFGEKLEINLLVGQDPALPRLLPRYEGGTFVWHLDLEALNAESTDDAVHEVAGVYREMSGGRGILWNSDAFMELIRNGQPELNSELEQAWRRWLKKHNSEDDLRLIETLKQDLQLAELCGGLEPQTFRDLLLGHVRLENMFGLKVSLRGRRLTSIPPLPDDVKTLDVSLNPIRDWSNLPKGVKVLDASQTGRDVLKHLPPDLIELNISECGLESLPANVKWPRGLKRLYADRNRLSDLPVLIDSIEELRLRGNRLRKIPEKLPEGVKVVDLSRNLITGPQAPNLPSSLERLNLSRNQLTGGLDLSRSRLKSVSFSHNPALAEFPLLPQTLKQLIATHCALQAPPADMPGLLETFDGAYNNFREIPGNFPNSLRYMDMTGNQVTSLPADLHRLTSCDIYLTGNPISPQNFPEFPAGQPAPRIHFSTQDAEGPMVSPSTTLAETVRYWLGPDKSEAAARWEAIGKALEGTAEGNDAILQFKRFLNRLRYTVNSDDLGFRDGIEEFLVKISKPERKPLLEHSMQACVGATERCQDRVSLVLNELTKMCINDDIRMGYYDERVVDALGMIRKMFRLDRVEQLAYEKIKLLEKELEEAQKLTPRIIDRGERIDDDEIYLAYAVKLREPLKLPTLVPKMAHFEVSRVTQADLEAAAETVRKAEGTDFYRYLVLNDTWNTLLRREFGETYEQAELRLHELAGEPLQKKIQTELQELGIDLNDLDAKRPIGKRIWDQMRFEVLEPLTKKFLTIKGISLPETVPAS